MKVEMKMKIPLLLILNGCCLLGFTAVNGAELDLAEDEMWSINGGVFHHPKDSMPEADELQGKVLVKNPSGVIRVVEFGQGPSTPVNQANIYVDRTAPVITDEWQGTINGPSGLIIGPNSQLQLSVNEAALKGLQIDGAVHEVNGWSHTLEFKQAVESIVVVAEDDYNNVSQKEFSLQSDFQAPEVNWTLMPPAIQTSGSWYAGDQAVLKLNTTDANEIGMIKVNEQQVDRQDNQLTVQAGDVIQVSDTLGNTNSVHVNWQQDTTEPEISIQVSGQMVAATKRLTVKVNELVEVFTVDEGVGVKDQKYKGKSRKWLPLPKKFRFTSKGNYRIQIFSEDMVGNKLETYLKFKVKR